MSATLTDIFAIVVVDGVEHVLRRETPLGTFPLVADSIERLSAMFKAADDACVAHGWQWQPVRFRRAAQMSKIDMKLGKGANHG